LFHNTPARRRFLKRPQTEYHHIHQFVRRLGFCRPEVSFVLNDDGRRRLSLPIAGDARSSERRWRQLFGAGFAAKALGLDIRAGDVRISGWIGDAMLARSQSDLQFLAVNGRTIRDAQLARAVRLAFDDRLHPGKYPAYA
jgi:DNA mismatch repair protein MutL